MRTKAATKYVTNGAKRTPPTTNSAKVCAITLLPARNRCRCPDRGFCLSRLGTQPHLPRSRLPVEPFHTIGAQWCAEPAYLALPSPRVLRPRALQVTHQRAVSASPRKAGPLPIGRSGRAFPLGREGPALLQR